MHGPSTRHCPSGWSANTAAESFFGVLTRERVNRQHYRSRAEARADIFDYIEVFYNRTRATVTSAALVPRPLNGPRREAPACPRYRGKSSLREN